MSSEKPSHSPHTRLIVINGDDFGFSSSVNHTIVEAHDRGILISANLMVTGKAFDEAVTLAKSCPTLADRILFVDCASKDLSCIVPALTLNYLLS